MENFEEVSELNHFNKMANTYDFNYGYNSDFFVYKRGKKIKACFDFLKSKDAPIKNILEIGAGTGEYTKELAILFPKARILASDISPQMLRVARKKLSKFKNVQCRKLTAYNIDLKGASVDVVVGFYVLHHLGDLKRVFYEIGRVLKKGGMGFFVEPNLINPAVWAVKNLGFLKKAVGDSPNEKAINPFGLKKYLGDRLELTRLYCRELLPPIRSVGFEKLVIADQFLSRFENWPIIKYLGGSVFICLKKH